MGEDLFHCEFVVLCAKPAELRALIIVFEGKFKKIKGKNVTDQIFEVRLGYKVRVTTCNSMGHTAAAVRTTQVIEGSHPGILIFLGTAASIKPNEVQIGDVVIPRKAIHRLYDKISEKGQADYEIRAAQPNFEEHFFKDNILVSDVTTISTAPSALDAIASLDISSLSLGAGTGKSQVIGGATVVLRPPEIHDDVDIFSCGMVVDSVSYRNFITKNANENLRKVAIIDMESFGFFSAIEALSNSGAGTVCSGLMIRGISDYAGRKKETELLPEGWRDASVRNAAEVAAALLEKLSL